MYRQPILRTLIHTVLFACIVCAVAVIPANAEEREGSADPDLSAAANAPDKIEAVLRDDSGKRLGTVVFSSLETGIQIDTHLVGLEPGEYALLLTPSGVCDDGSSLDKPANDGTIALPSMMVSEDGSATLSITTEAMTFTGTAGALIDRDGTGVALHRISSEGNDSASTEQSVLMACSTIPATIEQS